MQIFQGIAPSFLGNFSDTHGRRPAYVICCVVYLAANIGLALQNSYAALLVLRCIQSCGSSSTVALGSATAADMVTRAERGKYMGYAAMGVTLGPALGPIIGGLINEYLGWRWIFWFLSILSGALLLAILIFLPETCRATVGNGAITPPWWNMSLVGYLKSRKIETEATTTEKRPARKRPNPFASLRLLAEKETGIILLVGSLMYGGYFMVLTTLTAELSSRFGYTSVIIGLCYLPMGVGSLCYRYTGGFAIDWNFRRHARKNGISIIDNRQQDMENLPIERMRIEVSLPLVYLSSILVIIYGWLMENEISLPGLEVVLFFFSVAFVGAVTNLNTLIIDLNLASAATAVAANNLSRCLVSAGAVAIGAPLINRIGLGWTSVFIAGVWVAISPLLWLVMYRGQNWRQSKMEKA